MGPLVALLPTLLQLIQKKQQNQQPAQYDKTPPAPADAPKGFEGWSAKDAALAKLQNPPESNLAQGLGDGAQPDPWSTGLGY